MKMELVGCFKTCLNSRILTKIVIIRRMRVVGTAIAGRLASSESVELAC